ncbi:hypothetical protein AAG906_018884 [Vitis piasezkii]
MGCSVLDILFYLDLSLLDVLFIYTVKMSPKERFNLSTHISFLEFVTNLPYLSKDWVKGHVLVFSPWNGSLEGLNRVLLCNVRWRFQKASFAHLNNLFEIDLAKRTHSVLISDKNLRRSSCPKKKKNHVARHVLNARILSPAIPSSLFSSYSFCRLSLDDKPFSVGDIPYHKMRKLFVISGSIRELFQAMQRIPIKVDEDPNQSFIARLPYGTPNTTIFVTSCSSERTSSNDWKQ